MKIIGKTIIPLFLTTVMLASCNGFPSVLKTQPTQAMETALAIVGTAMAETQTAIPTATSTATSLPSATPLPTTTPLPPTKIPTITSSPIPVSGTPTVIALENGLTWLECVVPNDEYSYETSDIPTSCIGFPHWNFYDTRISGERIRGVNGTDLRLVIGQDSFLAKHDSTNGCCDYEFLKNGKVIRKTHASLITFDPNRHLWNIGEKAVWELIADPPVIIVDNIDFNEKYQLEGSFFPYEIKGKLIFIAKKNGKYNIVYDNKVIGPEFDKISMHYCCSGISVERGSNQYWFIGQREGTQYVVLIR